MNSIAVSISLKSTGSPDRRNILDPSGEIYLTSLIMRHDNPNKIIVFEAFDRLTSGETGDKP